MPRTSPPPPPLETNAVRVAVIGTVMWAIVAVVLTIWFRDELADADRTWWLGTAYSGVLIGLVGIEICRRWANR